MRMSKRRLISTLLLIATIFFIATYQLPYYIYKPGNADALNPIVAVEEGYESEGEMYLVTVSGLQATPLQYLMAKLTKYHEILPLEVVKPKGISDEDYMRAQLQMMEGSQQSSVVVAYEAADTEGKVGLGIQLVTDRIIDVTPEVHFSSGKIGGPSAGLMFALEIYDQLTEQDLTKGRQIIGTGALDYQGNVERIGGVDKKVIAADKAGCEIFFVPHENGATDSNYEVAKKTATEINSKMKIVPVDTFAEAVTFLEKLNESIK